MDIQHLCDCRGDERTWYIGGFDGDSVELVGSNAGDRLVVRIKDGRLQVGVPNDKYVDPRESDWRYVHDPIEVTL